MFCMDVDIIFCYPKRPYYWNYKLNEKTHGISSEKLYTFVKQFIDQTQFAILNSFINENISFMVDPVERKVFKLKKKKDTMDYHHTDLINRTTHLPLDFNQSGTTFEDKFKEYSEIKFQ